MKNSIKSSARMILGGFLLFFILDVSNQCESYNLDAYLDTDPDTDSQYDITGMNDGAKEAMNAFLTGNPATVLEQISDSASVFYGDMINTVSASDFKALGEAFRTRTLTVASEAYAEFEYQNLGKTYTLALGLHDDGTWKIIRF